MIERDVTHASRLIVYNVVSVILFSIEESTKVICAVLVRNKEFTHKENLKWKRGACADG